MANAILGGIVILMIFIVGLHLLNESGQAIRRDFGLGTPTAAETEQARNETQRGLSFKNPATNARDLCVTVGMTSYKVAPGDSKVIAIPIVFRGGYKYLEFSENSSGIFRSHSLCLEDNSDKVADLK